MNKSFREVTGEANKKDHIQPLFSRIFFSHISPLVKNARHNGRLDLDHDVAVAVGSVYSSDLLQVFDALCARESSYATAGALVKIAMRAVCYREMIMSMLFAIVYILTQLLIAYFVFLLVRSLGDEDDTSYSPLWYSLGMFTVQIVSAFSNQFALHYSYSCGLRLRSLFIALIYRHFIKLRSEQLVSDFSISNLIAIDSQKFVEICEVANYVWVAPVATIIGTCILFAFIGISALAGVGILLLLVPLNYSVGHFLGKVRKNHMPVLDTRVNLLADVIENIRVVKYYGWDMPFLNSILGLRAKEVPYVYREVGAWGALIGILIVTPGLASLAAFSLHILRGEPMNADIVFGSLVILNWIKFPLMHFSQGLSLAVQLSVAVRRIWTFLDRFSLPEVRTETPVVVANDFGTSLEIQVSNTDIRWNPDTPIALNNVSLTIHKNELVIIIGSIGSGKSALLNFLVKEISMQAGAGALLPDYVAYSCQTPYIMNSTVRNNILFQFENSALDTPAAKIAYKKSIQACCLETDFAAWRFGDQTMIGEKGVTLSGGQKARVALARACMASLQNQFPIFLDDPLSALDMKTATTVFDKLLSRNGILEGNTRILVTHNLSLLKHADRVIVLDEGHMVFNDTPTLLPALETLRSLPNSTNKLDSILLRLSQNVCDDEFDDEFDTVMDHTPEDVQEEEISKEEDEVLMDDEDRSETSGVAFAVIIYYFQKAGGILWFVIVMLAFVLERTSYVLVDYWLATWTKAAAGVDVEFIGIDLPSDDSTGVYRRTYALLILLMLVMVMVRLQWFAIGLAVASKNLFIEMVSRVMDAPIQFFESNPHGRIMNRLSYDVEVLDLPLIQALNGSIASMFWLFTSVIVMLAVVPIAAVGLVPAMIVFFYYHHIYRSSCVELQRIDNVARSPMMSCLGETISGGVTLRAFGKTEMISERMEELVDRTYCAIFAFVSSNRWLGVRIECLGAFVTLAVSIGCWAAKDQVSASMAGLALTWSFNCAMSFQFFVNLSTKAEAKLTSVERIVHYCKNLPKEAPRRIPEIDDKIPSDWPQTGLVKYEDITMRYRPEYDPALRSVSFEILPGEHISVIGRTGSGKSTLGQTLLRLRDPDSGCIYIDGIDILTVGTDLMRGRADGGICIIPQDPVVFSGTLQFNLDPFHVYSDEQVWGALKMVQMDQNLKSLFPVLGLNATLSSGGHSLSVGQNQLLCLARALLRNPRILVMDEATASVDAETDYLIQNTVKKYFSQTTVIEIAHRLHSQMEADKILVLDHGSVVEFGPPIDLIRDDVVHPEAGLKSILDSMKPNERKSLLQRISTKFEI